MPMRPLERKILTGVILAVMVYAGFAIWADAHAVLDRVRSLPYHIFMWALALTVVNYALRFVKWSVLLRRIGVAIPNGESALIFVAGMSMSITPGKIGEVLKSVLLRDACDVPIARSAPIVFMERLTDLLGLVLIAAFGISRFEYGRVPFLLVCAGLVVTVFILQRPRWVHRILSFGDRHPRLAPLRDKTNEIYDSTHSLLDWRVLSTTTLVSVLSWGMEAMAFHLLVEGLGGHADFALTSFIYAMSTIIGAISFLPGGLGVTEGSMIGVLGFFSVFDNVATGTAATYLIRFATLWFGVAAGFIALAMFRATHRHNRPLDL